MGSKEKERPEAREQMTMSGGGFLHLYPPVVGDGGGDGLNMRMIRYT